MRQKVAKKAYKDNISLKQAALDLREYVMPRNSESFVNPSHMLQASRVLVIKRGHGR